MDLWIWTSGLAVWQSSPAAPISDRFGTEMEISSVVSSSVSLSTLSSSFTSPSSSPAALSFRNNFLMMRCCSMIVWNIFIAFFNQNIISVAWISSNILWNDLFVENLNYFLSINWGEYWIMLYYGKNTYKAIYWLNIERNCNISYCFCMYLQQVHYKRFYLFPVGNHLWQVGFFRDQTSLKYICLVL